MNRVLRSALLWLGVAILVLGAIANWMSFARDHAVAWLVGALALSLLAISLPWYLNKASAPKSHP